VARLREDGPTLTEAEDELPGIQELIAEARAEQTAATVAQRSAAEEAVFSADERDLRSEAATLDETIIRLEQGQLDREEAAGMDDKHPNDQAAAELAAARERRALIDRRLQDMADARVARRKRRKERLRRVQEMLVREGSFSEDDAGVMALTFTEMVRVAAERNGLTEEEIDQLFPVDIQGADAAQVDKEHPTAPAPENADSVPIGSREAVIGKPAATPESGPGKAVPGPSSDPSGVPGVADSVPISSREPAIGTPGGQRVSTSEPPAPRDPVLAEEFPSPPPPDPHRTQSP